jgi:hypothetical protein
MFESQSIFSNTAASPCKGLVVSPTKAVYRQDISRVPWTVPDSLHATLHLLLTIYLQSCHCALFPVGKWGLKADRGAALGPSRKFSTLATAPTLTHQEATSLHSAGLCCRTLLWSSQRAQPARPW